MLNECHFAVFRLGVRSLACDAATGLLAAMRSRYAAASSHSTLNDLGAAVDMLPNTGATAMDNQTAATVNAGSHTMKETMIADGKTLQFPLFCGNVWGIEARGKRGGDTGKNPINSGLKAANGEWQPVGDSNPCDGTENPAS